MPKKSNSSNKNKLPNKKPNKFGAGNQILIFAVIFLIVLLFIMLNDDSFGLFKEKPINLSYSKFIEKVEQGKVKKVKIVEQNIEGSYQEIVGIGMGDTTLPITQEQETKPVENANNTNSNEAATNAIATTKPSTMNMNHRVEDIPFTTYIPYTTDDLVTTLLKHNVEIIGEPKQNSLLPMILINILPILLLIGFVWFFMFRQVQGSNNKAMSFGRSKAKLLRKEEANVTFDDVEGCVEAKEDLKEVVDFLKTPEKYQKLGAKIPKGVLLVGPPGTGKTLLAKAVAGEANVPYFSMSGSEFVEMFVGVGASRVRDLFEQGRKNSPCIIFIDELDAVGRTRGAGYGGGHDEREQTLNQMLVEMDGFGTDTKIIIFAATNRPDVLDPALLRPGRFDRQVIVDIPDVKGREGIFKIHSKKVKIDEKNVDYEILARSTPGFSGADIANVVNEAALVAAKRDKSVVEMEDFEEARDKVMMGPERRSLVMTENELINTAYHESGHALLAILLKETDALHKITIIPRGRALGATMILPTEAQYTINTKTLLDQIAMLYGGRIVEEHKFGIDSITSGASNDIERASKLAKRMVCEWGMSKLGPITYGQKEHPIFLGKEIASHQDYSEETARKVDETIQNILLSEYKRAKSLIVKNFSKIEKLTKALLEEETLDIERIEKLLKIKIDRKSEKLIKAGDKRDAKRLSASGGKPTKATKSEKKVVKKPKNT